jgi:eukaryotic-like serine/threonine-protein kinase
MSDAPWKLPGYLVEGRLGTGGSGEVWRARTAAGDLVALKRIMIADPGQIAAARVEGALLSTLDHPHLIRLLELVPTADAVVLVLDFAAGGSLADLLAVRGRLAPGEVITALAPVAAALAYAHTAGVVHGDVSAANILFTEAGFPLLADLGVARLVSDNAPVHSTPAYIDPAVAAGAVPGPQSDVFMLGAVALHALTGAPPWPGDTREASMAAALAADLSDVDARMRAAGVPEPIRAVVAGALEIEPARRGTAADFALELRHAGVPVAVELSAGRARAEPPSSGAAAVEAGQGAIHTHAVGPRARPVRGRRRRKPPSIWRRRHVRWSLAALSAVALAAGAGIAWGQLADNAAPNDHPASTALAGAPSGHVPFDPVSGWSASGQAPSSSTAASATAKPLTAADAAAVLIRLDSVRESAFARRAPVLLTGVYVPGTLLDQDTALLKRLVPSGCGLQNVHTTYSQVKVTSTKGDQVELSARATLSGSVLICGGVAKAEAAGSGPTALTIVLVRKRTGYLIAAITH